MHGSVRDQNYSSDKLQWHVPILNLQLVFRLTKHCPAGSRKGNRAARRGSAKGKFIPGEEGVAVESGTGRGSDSFLDKHHIYSAVDTATSAASQHGHLVQRCYKHEHQCLWVGWTPGVRHATLFYGHPSTHKCSVHPHPLSRTLIPNSMFPTLPVLGASYCSRLTFGLVFLRLSSPFHQLSIHSIMKLLLFWPCLLHWIISFI